MKYLFTGGGTGGHVYPALAVADEIRRRDSSAQILYVGVRGRLEERAVPERGYPLRFASSRPFPRSLSMPALARFGLSLGWGVLHSMGILLRFRPDVIFGTGGFAGAPIMFACSLLKKVGLSRSVVFVYEPNVHPGLLNQAVGGIADRIGVAFEHAGRWFDMKRVAIVGFPVRRELLEAQCEQARRELGIDPKARVVLAFGGSQGSKVINQAIVAALPELRRQHPDLVVLHATGRSRTSDYDAVTGTESVARDLGIEIDSAYRRFEYFENIGNAYAAADVVICRGGMSTLTEVGLRGLPAIVVPLSTAAEDHQAMNARELMRRGAVTVIYEEARWSEEQKAPVTCVSPTRLVVQLHRLLIEDGVRTRMGRAATEQPRPDSLELILQEIDALTSGRRPAPLNLEFPVIAGSLPTDPNRMLRYVQKHIEDVGGVTNLPVDELDYLRYQVDRYLVSTEWYEIPLGRRNVGVKLVGVLDYEDRIELMLAILGDRRPVGGLKRLVGGDFCHPGILRRNIVDWPLRMIGLRRGGRSVYQAILNALAEDPYFEVRAAAARVIGEQAEPGGPAEGALMKALTDPAPAVVVKVIRGLGTIATNAAVVDRLRMFYMHPDWQFRQETVGALQALLHRGVVPAEAIAQDLDQILTTSPNFEPAFPLKERIHNLSKEVFDNGGGNSDSQSPRNTGSGD
ncbi:MAG: glycosyltransferase [Candidatus Latescibacterota bacterium]|nr:glycosyltransferase [Candidatus Latescibacterota bacterium]